MDIVEFTIILRRNDVQFRFHFAQPGDALVPVGKLAEGGFQGASINDYHNLLGRRRPGLSPEGFSCGQPVNRAKLTQPWP
jgi:hypothetical protein